ncbi:MAG: N-acetyl-gamma-glutamyl-phosphate reductase [Ferruginibacter sp.]
MAAKIKIGIIGGAGYTGGELIRILLNHPAAEIIFVNSKSNADHFLYEVHKDLQGETTMKFTSATDEKIDVLFLCVGHGEAMKYLSGNKINEKIKVIDLSQDFRLGETVQKRKFVYGLPELNKTQIKKAKNIANPGCFATAIQLGLLPLAKAGLLKEVHTTGITGSTGAGQGLNTTSHFSWRANNIQAYKTLSHQHLGEIHQSLHQLQGSFPPSPEGEGPGVRFVPWRGDFTRGIFISSQIKCSLELKEIAALYKKYYAAHPFIVLSEEAVFLKQVVNTNKCFIQLEKIGTNLVVHSIIDNLTKGASGQAVQNMNLMFGLEEMAGLKLKANYF